MFNQIDFSCLLLSKAVNPFERVLYMKKAQSIDCACGSEVKYSHLNCFLKVLGEIPVHFVKKTYEVGIILVMQAIGNFLHGHGGISQKLLTLQYNSIFNSFLIGYSAKLGQIH